MADTVYVCVVVYTVHRRFMKYEAKFLNMETFQVAVNSFSQGSLVVEILIIPYIALLLQL